jgi:hypothetical protein
LIEDEMPECLLKFCAHKAGYDVLMERWKQAITGNTSQWCDTLETSSTTTRLNRAPAFSRDVRFIRW